MIDAALARKLPTMFADEGNVALGALAGCGESYHTIGRHLAQYVQRVLLGAAPGELPVEQLDRLYFVISLKMAKALGLTIS